MSFEDFSIHFRMSMYSVSDLEPEVDCQTVYWIIQSVMSPVFILQLLHESVQGFKTCSRGGAPKNLLREDCGCGFN